MAKVQDEAGHGLYLYSAAETLGVDRDELLDLLHAGRQKYSSIFNYPTLTWADMGAIGWLVDGAAIINQVPLCRCSYGPYARAMVRICKEESFHQRQGFEILLHALRTARRSSTRWRRTRSNRWWWPSPDDVRPAGRRRRRNSAQSMAWRSSGTPTTSCGSGSSTCRVPQAEVLGLTLPDPDLRWNDERGHYDFGQIDWTRVLSRCSRATARATPQRIEHRGAAHDEGAWVREAASRVRRAAGAAEQAAA